MRQIVITVGRRYGSGGHEIGQKLAERLGIPFYDRELVELAAEKSGIDEGILAIYNERKGNSSLLKTKSGTGNRPLGDLLFQTQSQIIQELADRGSCVIIGRCGDYVLRDREDVFSVFVTAPMASRVQRIMERNRMSLEDAQAAVEKVDSQRREYYEHFSGKKWGEIDGYDLIVDSSVLGVEGTVNLLAGGFEAVSD